MQSASAQNPLTPQEKQIYLLGTSKSGKDIFAYVGESSLENDHTPMMMIGNDRVHDWTRPTASHHLRNS